MRKWFSSTCSECGRDNGYWQDVVEGPITLEQHKQREQWNNTMQTIYRPVIERMLSDYDKIINRHSNSRRAVNKMATTITCDKCGDEIKPDNVYKVRIKEQEYDLDINCAAEVQSAIEGNA